MNNNIRIYPPRIGKWADRFAQGFHKSSHCVPPGELPDDGAFRSRYVRLEVFKKREREKEKNGTRVTSPISCNGVG